MDLKELETLVRKYLDGAATPEECQFMEAWFRHMDIPQSIGSTYSPEEIAKLEPEIFSKVSVDIAAVTLSIPPAQARIRRITRYAGVAAALLLMVTGVWLFYRHPANPAAQYTDLYANLGKVRKITLADGSQVWLNADSRIKFATAFGNSREVFLEGEAYFEVAKDERHPFLVHTRNLTTRVLGTRFNVNAYSGSGSIEVTLLEGKVMLSAPSDTLLLAPHQRAVFMDNILAIAHRDSISNPRAAGAFSGPPVKATPVLTKLAADHDEDAAAWREGNLVFRNTPVEDIIPRLERKFSIRIQCDSALLRQQITADIGSGLNADAALLEVTRQLRRPTQGPAYLKGREVQFRVEDSVYVVE